LALHTQQSVPFWRRNRRHCCLFAAHRAGTAVPNRLFAYRRGVDSPSRRILHVRKEK
jgi:hypothetical protein